MPPRACVTVRGSSGNNSVVECDLAKVEVAGSNPVSRSSLRSHSWRASYGWRANLRAEAVRRSPEVEGGRWLFASATDGWQATLVHRSAARREGGLRGLSMRAAASRVDPPFCFSGAPSPRGKAEVCKTSTPGSNPGGASNLRSRLPTDRELRLASHAKVAHRSASRGGGPKPFLLFHLPADPRSACLGRSRTLA